MGGLTDLDKMLATLEPEVREGEYVYLLDPGPSTVLEVEAMVTEAEGRALVVRREVADRAGLAYESAFAWIALRVHSSLEAVGLTAAFSAALGAAGISCNVLAGLHHDHILVPVRQCDEAVRVLRSLAGQAR
jgi:hypothetical protein